MRGIGAVCLQSQRADFGKRLLVGIQYLSERIRRIRCGQSMLSNRISLAQDSALSQSRTARQKDQQSNQRKMLRHDTLPARL